MERLISMRDFVLEQNNYRQQRFSQIVDYAMFLKQPLELWMFVPCDEDGNVLENKFYPSSMSFSNDANIYREKYQQAKERCLFVWQKGFDYKVICEMFKDLEDIILFEFELTQTAKKQIFG